MGTTRRTTKTATTTGRTNTTKTNIPTDQYVIRSDWFGNGYYILRNGFVLTNTSGWTRYFATRNSARKRVSRERRGDFHN